MLIKKYLVVLFVVSIFSSQANNPAISKPDFVKKAVQFHGNVGVNSNYYASTNIEARRPSNVTRFNFGAELQVGRYFKIPLRMNLSSLPVHFGSFEDEQSVFSNFDLNDFVVNPVNNVSTGLHYKAFKLDVGTVNAKSSKLTMSGVPMFGAGLDWSPGHLILQAYSGVSQHAIQSDASNNVAGQFKRNMNSIRFGLGKIETSYWALNFVQGKDDSTSVADNNGILEAQQGIVLSLDLGIKLSKKVKWKGEIAGSVFTTDEKSLAVDVENPVLDLVRTVMPWTFSTFADIAANTELTQSYKYWSLALKGEYIGAGFRTMGQPFLQPDRLDITAAPSMKLFKNKVNFSFNGGYRVNNLVGTKGATSTQMIMATNLSAQVAKGLTLAFNYSNFGIENDAAGDTLRIRNVTTAYGFSPSYTREGKHGSNTFSVSGTYNDFEDFNVVSGALNSNNSMVYAGSYNRTFKKFPLSLSLTGTQFDLSSSLFEVHTTNASLTTGYKFFKKTLNVSLTSTYSINRSAAPESDNQLTFRLSSSYTTKSKLSISLSASNNEYNYGATSGASFYRENLVDLGLTQKF